MTLNAEKLREIISSLGTLNDSSVAAIETLLVDEECKELLNNQYQEAYVFRNEIQAAILILKISKKHAVPDDVALKLLSKRCTVADIDGAFSYLKSFQKPPVAKRVTATTPTPSSDDDIEELVPIPQRKMSIAPVPIPNVG